MTSMSEQWVVTGVFLLSWLIVFALTLVNSKYAAALFCIFGFGWLGIIVWYGLLRVK